MKLEEARRVIKELERQEKAGLSRVDLNQVAAANGGRPLQLSKEFLQQLADKPPAMAQRVAVHYFRIWGIQIDL